MKTEFPLCTSQKPTSSSPVVRPPATKGSQPHRLTVQLLLHYFPPLPPPSSWQQSQIFQRRHKVSGLSVEGNKTRNKPPHIRSKNDPFVSTLFLKEDTTRFWSWENSCLYRAVPHYRTPECMCLLLSVL